MQKALTLLAAGLASVSALPFISARDDAIVSEKLLVSGPGYVASVDFDSTGLNARMVGVLPKGMTPSWLVKDGNTTLYSNDENSASAWGYDFYAAQNGLDGDVEGTGSKGIVHLAFNKDHTRMIGSGYGSQAIDIWNTEGGKLKLIKTLPVAAVGGAMSHPHQAVLDPSGKFFIVNDLGLDILHIINAQSDKFTITSTVATPKGCGPRHGSFYPPTGDKATHYLVVCENLNQVLVWPITSYKDDSLVFGGTAPLAAVSTYADKAAPANITSAHAAELLLAYNDKDGSADIYVSNRMTGGDTDSITHLRITKGSEAKISPLETVSSGGRVPRGMTLGFDNKHLFVGNQGDTSGKAQGAGLVAYARDATSGKLSDKPVGTVDAKVFAAGGPDFGPQMVLAWGKN